MVGFLNSPMPEMRTITSSPGFSHRGGFRPNPTPAGVPVMNTSPGSSVTAVETYSISSGMRNTISRVFELCSVSPPISSEISSACGSGISSLVTIQGPMGANVSNVLPISHCVVAVWKSRALTSLTMVYPST